ncbi:hypothetical protein AAHC03_020625 [Spirometra sp. Aus1]
MEQHGEKFVPHMVFDRMVFVVIFLWLFNYLEMGKPTQSSRFFSLKDLYRKCWTNLFEISEKTIAELETHRLQSSFQLYRGFLGAVTALSWEHVEKVNGASNIFYGWGGEDDDLAIRLRLNNIAVDRPSRID